MATDGGGAAARGVGGRGNIQGRQAKLRTVRSGSLLPGVFAARGLCCPGSLLPGVFAAYVSRHGHAFIDRAIYLPKGLTDDLARLKATYVPSDKFG